VSLVLGTDQREMAQMLERDFFLAPVVHRTQHFLRDEKGEKMRERELRQSKRSEAKKQPEKTKLKSRPKTNTKTKIKTETNSKRKTPNQTKPNQT
jgi:hypothetical protein